MQVMSVLVSHQLIYLSPAGSNFQQGDSYATSPRGASALVGYRLLNVNGLRTIFHFTA